MKTAKIAALVAVAGAATVASAMPFDILKFDIQQFNFDAFDANGAAADLRNFGTTPIGATTESLVNFDGRIDFTFNVVTTVQQAVEGRNKGSAMGFVNAGDGSATNGGVLTAFTGTVDIVNGSVRGGNFAWANDQGDSVNTDVTRNSGALTRKANGTFSITGLLVQFLFNTTDETYGTVLLDRFYDSNGQNIPAVGDFATIRLDETNGTADGEFTVITIPTPTAAAMGLLGLGAVAGRRRR